MSKSALTSTFNLECSSLQSDSQARYNSAEATVGIALQLSVGWNFLDVNFREVKKKLNLNPFFFFV